jgi:cysteinyl-tRNA synthetase
MSKSLGNQFTLRELVDRGNSPQAIRYLLLSVHYRKQLNFTSDGLRQAASSIERLGDFRARMRDRAGPGDPDPELGAVVASAREAFVEALDDDLNTSAALGVVFDFMRSTNQAYDQERLTPADARAAAELLEEVDLLFGVLPAEPALLDADVAARIEERNAARRRRDFAESDRIRDWLLSQGIQLEDTREGTRWKRAR